MALTPAQRAALVATKLRALVAFGWPDLVEGTQPLPFQAGAGLLSADGKTAWLFVDETRVERDLLDQAAEDEQDSPLPRGWLGGAALTALRRSIEQLHVISDHLRADDARRASQFAFTINLWLSEGRSLREVHDTVPLAEQVASPPDAVDELFVAAIRRAGAEPVVEHGVLRAEVLGLEVARVEHDEDGVPRLAVGVGRHDRLAQAMMYSTTDLDVALVEAVEAVRAHRRADVGPHPANLLALERWLREAVLASRGSVLRDAFAAAGIDVDSVSWERVEGTERARLKRPNPAMLLARNAAGGTPVAVIACTGGVDLDAVPAAADARLRHASPETPLFLVVPETDAYPSLRSLASSLRDPAMVVTVARDWKTLIA